MFEWNRWRMKVDKIKWKGIEQNGMEWDIISISANFESF
jgi:hypothetical protein